MSNSGPEDILKSLRQHSQKDEKVSKFLVEIFNEELRGIHFWKKSYNKILKNIPNNGAMK